MKTIDRVEDAVITIAALFLSTILLLATGCSHTKECSKEINVPQDMVSSVNQSVFSARSCIEEKGQSVSLSCGYQVIKHSGETKGKNGWGWYDAGYKTYVCGLTGHSPSRGWFMEIGVNPKTGKEWNQDTLTHECGHLLLMQTFGEWDHVKRYSTCFASWNSPSGKLNGYPMFNGDLIAVDFLESDGPDIYHREDGSDFPEPSYTNDASIYDGDKK